MTNSIHQEQIDKNCAVNDWDGGNDSSMPTSQAMGGGVSTVKEKCNAATNESYGGLDDPEQY